MSRLLKKSEYDQPRLIDQLDIHLNSPVELAVLSVRHVGMRCRHIPSQLPVTYRMVRSEIEGEIITILPSKVWQFKNTVYMSGETISRRIDVNALNLVPLKLTEIGLFSPDNEDLFNKDDSLSHYYQTIIDFGNRKEYEMEQIIPFYNPHEFEDDPIIQANDALECGDRASAYRISKELLAEDLRCIEAYSLLGNLVINRRDTTTTFSLKEAKRHFEIGIKIAELSFDSDFNGLLPWYNLNNRPYLRCLYGYGECLYGLGEIEKARTVFDKIFWLNPYDDQGTRAVLAAIDSKKSWQDLINEEIR